MATTMYPLPLLGIEASDTRNAWCTLAMKLIVDALASSKLMLGYILTCFLYFRSGSTPGW
jgi:hypothetical protein